MSVPAWALAMSRKENALDLAKFVDKGVRVKLAGGREGELAAKLSKPLFV